MKSPARVILAAVGNSAWVPLSYIHTPFDTTLACILSSDGNLTYSVQYTYDQMDNSEDVLATFTRTTTTVTVTYPGHGLSTNDSVITYASTDANIDSLKDSGNRPIAQDVTVVDANTFTYTVLNSGLALGSLNVKRFRIFTHSVLATLTARQDSNFNLPCSGVRLKVTVFSAGKVEMMVTQGQDR